jgi:hypothetical protein
MCSRAFDYRLEMDTDERNVGYPMKSITLNELISVIVVLIMLIGIGYCVYMVTDLKYQAQVVDVVGKYQKQMDSITEFLNRQVKEGRLK